VPCYKHYCAVRVHETAPKVEQESDNSALSDPELCSHSMPVKEPASAVCPAVAWHSLGRADRGTWRQGVRRWAVAMW
jgi:hypothetical protein